MELAEAAPDAVASVGFDEVPDFLLADIFRLLTFQYRYSGPALVCRRWSRLLCSPHLLRKVGVVCVDSCLRRNFMSRLESLCHWLLQHAAGHMQQLALGLHIPSDLSPEDSRQCYTMLGAMLAGCGMAGLRMLCIRIYPTSLWELNPTSTAAFHLGSWAPALRNLQLLDIGPATSPPSLRLTVAAAMQGLTQLEVLRLSGSELSVSPATRLPTSLTKLRLAGLQGPMPAHCARLSKLQELRAMGLREPSVDFSSLSAITSLSKLVLSYSGGLPSGISLLTSLQALSIHCEKRSSPADGAPGLQEALLLLVHLTSLVTYAVPQPGAHLPAVLTWLPQLQRFACLRGKEPDAVALPPGRWLTQLRCMAVPASWVLASLSALSEVQRLSQLSLEDFAKLESPAPASILRWAAQQRAQEQLRLELAVGSFKALKQETLDAMMEAQQGRAGLCIDAGWSWGSM